MIPARVPDARWREPIGEAFAIIGPRMTDRIGPVRFICADPVFIGLHHFTDTGDGRSYRNTAHCCYGSHIARPADDRLTTVVLPEPPTLDTVVHELGHALDAALGFTHDAVPVTHYAQTDRQEAFAEAFVAWHWWGYEELADVRTDGATVALFRELAA